MNKLSSGENKVPRTLFEARQAAGSATDKQIETAWHCVVVDISLFIQSWKRREFIYLVCFSSDSNVVPTTTQCTFNGILEFVTS